jgi:hypothetical protein
MSCPPKQNKSATLEVTDNMLRFPQGRERGAPTCQDLALTPTTGGIPRCPGVRLVEVEENPDRDRSDLRIDTYKRRADTARQQDRFGRKDHPTTRS